MGVKSGEGSLPALPRVGELGAGGDGKSETNEGTAENLPVSNFDEVGDLDGDTGERGARDNDLLRALGKVMIAEDAKLGLGD